MKRRIIVLEKNVTQLTQMYHQIANQRATLSIDVQMKDKSLKRKAQKIEELDKQIGNLKEDSKNLRAQADLLKEIVKKRLEDGEQILSQPVFTQATFTYTLQTNVVKPLRGGGGKDAIQFFLGRKKSGVSGMLASDKIDEEPELEGSLN